MKCNTTHSPAHSLAHAVSLTSSLRAAIVASFRSCSTRMRCTADSCCRNNPNPSSSAAAAAALPPLTPAPPRDVAVDCPTPLPAPAPALSPLPPLPQSANSNTPLARPTPSADTDGCCPVCVMRWVGSSSPDAGSACDWSCRLRRRRRGAGDRGAALGGLRVAAPAAVDVVGVLRLRSLDRSIIFPVVRGRGRRERRARKRLEGSTVVCASIRRTAGAYLTTQRTLGPQRSSLNWVES